MKPTIIGIAGGTASGKTTIAKRLFDEASKNGSVSLIRLDDYYFNMDKVVRSKTGKLNYDHPDSYDIDYIMNQLNELKEGHAINKPIYDFVTHSRMSEYEVVEPSNIIIVEGIMAFAFDKLLPLYDIKIFVDTADDIRFIRRLQRDIAERGRTVESVIEQYVNVVRPGHFNFIEPAKEYADLIIPEGGYNESAMQVLISFVNSICEE
jgi:uridine kinase